MRSRQFFMWMALSLCVLTMGCFLSAATRIDLFGIVIVLGGTILLASSVAWLLLARASARMRGVLDGLLGGLLGAVGGFLVTFIIVLVIGMSPWNPFGEMAGVAAISFGFWIGIPTGAILFRLAIRWAVRNDRFSV